MMGFYSRAAMRQAREEREARELAGPPAPLTLGDIPADAEYEDPDAVLHVWADGRFIPYTKWLASAPISIDSVPAAESSIPRDAKCLAADCGGTHIWLVRDGDRWLMYAGSRGAAGRRRDFASPFLGHAIRTAEFWYGVAAEGWRAEERANGREE